jgi:hypothetical protein
VLTGGLCASGIETLVSDIKEFVNYLMDIRETECKGGRKIELALNRVQLWILALSVVESVRSAVISIELTRRNSQ